ncbi:hypothetical protein [Pectobacterium atrosepticum]|uniref:hypothetical protein n=2 Tax=Pectobacterium atrosepticum TaxID=29471 RepID=UPI001FCA4167|nr:hypothetical protein [Pectobacterium atrosepticum]
MGKVAGLLILNIQGDEMYSDNNKTFVDVFSGEFSVNDNTWSLDAVRWSFVEKEKIIASLKGKMRSGPFEAEITLLWREEIGGYFGKGAITYHNFGPKYKHNEFSVEIGCLDVYIEEDICVIKKQSGLRMSALIYSMVNWNR